MKRLVWGIGLLAVVALGIIAFFIFWPPEIRMVALQENAVPEATRQIVMPIISESGSGYVLRAYGAGKNFEFVGYSVGKSHRGLFVFDLDGKRVAQGGDFETPFGVSESYALSTATKTVSSFFAWGGATDARIVKVIGTTAQGEKYEATPQNGFWWLWADGPGKWQKFEAVSKAGRVLYSKTSELSGK